MQGFHSLFGGQRFAHHRWICWPLRVRTWPREEYHAKGGETQPVQQDTDQADEGNTLAEEDDAKEQRAEDRQWPDDKQEGRRRERGHQPADTALQDREDQDIKPDDDQPDKSNPPYLCRLSYIQCRKTQQQENATQEVDERSSDRRDGQVEVCHGHK